MGTVTSLRTVISEMRTVTLVDVCKMYYVSNAPVNEDTQPCSTPVPPESWKVVLSLPDLCQFIKDVGLSSVRLSRVHCSVMSWTDIFHDLEF